MAPRRCAASLAVAVLATLSALIVGGGTSAPCIQPAVGSGLETLGCNDVHPPDGWCMVRCAAGFTGTPETWYCYSSGADMQGVVPVCTTTAATTIPPARQLGHPLPEVDPSKCRDDGNVVAAVADPFLTARGLSSLLLTAADGSGFINVNYTAAKYTKYIFSMKMKEGNTRNGNISPHGGFKVCNLEAHVNTRDSSPELWFIDRDVDWGYGLARGSWASHENPKAFYTNKSYYGDAEPANETEKTWEVIMEWNAGSYLLYSWTVEGVDFNKYSGLNSGCPSSKGTDGFTPRVWSYENSEVGIGNFQVFQGDNVSSLTALWDGPKALTTPPSPGTGYMEAAPPHVTTENAQDCVADPEWNETMACEDGWDVVDLQRCDSSIVPGCQFTCKKHGSCLPDSWVQQGCDIFLLSNSSCNGAVLPSVAGICFDDPCKVQVAADISNRSCRSYCQQQDLQCSSAGLLNGDDCEGMTDVTCDHRLIASDLMMCECGSFTTLGGNHSSPERMSRASACNAAIDRYTECMQSRGSADLGGYGDAKEKIAQYISAEPAKQCITVDKRKADRLGLIPCHGGGAGSAGTGR